MVQDVERLPAKLQVVTLFWQTKVFVGGKVQEKTGWTDDRELLVADADDPSGFASRVVALYRSEALWNRLRRAAMARLRRDNGRESYAEKIGAVLPAHDSTQVIVD